MDIAIAIFTFIVLIFSAVLHEIAHGYEAERLGDPTARNAGRLTLNPLKHIDPFGSIVLPLLLLIPVLFGQSSFIIGWAKPVPYDPRNLKYPRSGSARIALAGPITNILLAFVFGMIMRIAIAYFPVSDTFLTLLGVIVYINILLAIFNLIPIPPLDGSRVLFAALPPNQTVQRAMYSLERFGFFLVLIFIFFGFGLIVPAMRVLFTLFTGQLLGI